MIVVLIVTSYLQALNLLFKYQFTFAVGGGYILIWKLKLELTLICS